MANVLPQQAQKKLWSMYRSRFLIAFGALAILLAFLALLVLVPSYFAIRLAAPPSVEVTIPSTQPQPGATVDLARAQALTEAVLPLLSSTTSPSAILASALAERPKGLTVERITYAADTKQLTLAGSAPGESVSAFRDALQKDERFSSVSVPVSALLSSGGGHFSITLTAAY